MSEPRFDNLTAISGGIGSGKSVVSRMVEAMGFEVYDCDSRARQLMDSAAIKDSLAAEFGSGIFDSEGVLVRKALADIVFADAGRLDRLNGIVHGAVRDDLAAWASARRDVTRIFVETAILYQSYIDRMVAVVWEVSAPVETRIARVAERNGLSPDEIMARIASQDSFEAASLHPMTEIIVNDGIIPLLPRIETLLQWKQHSSLSPR